MDNPVVDPAQLKKTHEWKVDGIPFDVARIPETGRLLYGSSDFAVYEFDTSAEKPEPVAFEGDGHESYVTTVGLTSGGLVSGSYDGRLIWWDAEQRRQVRAVDAHDRWIRNISTSPDGSRVVSVADDMTCRIWDAASGEQLSVFRDHAEQTPHHYPSMLYAVAISSDGRYLATGDKVGQVVVRDLDSGEKVAELHAPVMYTWDPQKRRHSIGGIRSLAFSPDAQLLAVGGIGTIGNIDHLGGPARIELFQWQSGKRLHEIENAKHKGLVEQILFHPDGSWFLAAGGDHNGFVSFYNTETGEVIHQDKAPMHIHGCAFTEDHATLYGVGHGKIAAWSLTG